MPAIAKRNGDGDESERYDEKELAKGRVSLDTVWILRQPGNLPRRQTPTHAAINVKSSQRIGRPRRRLQRIRSTAITVARSVSTEKAHSMGSAAFEFDILVRRCCCSAFVAAAWNPWLLIGISVCVMAQDKLD